MVAAAQRIFGMGGESRLKLAAKKGTWAKLLKKMFAMAVQREYVEELTRSEIGREYLAHKPEFGRAQWIDDARGLVRWGRQTDLYQLFRLRGAGHDLNTVTCFYSWTKHSAMCACKVRWETPAHRHSGPRAAFLRWVESKRGPKTVAAFRARTHDKQWAEVMEWLNGGGDWEQDERSGMLLAVLDLVCRAAKCE